MADYIVKDTELTSVANAIRTAGGTNSLLSFPNGFVSAVGNISGGGGGSSDFSTATVTVINNLAHGTSGFYIPNICEANEWGEGSPAMIYNKMICASGESTHLVRMYKGLLYCADVGFSPSATVSTTGDIVIDGDTVSITGDCTITIS